MRCGTRLAHCPPCHASAPTPAPCRAQGVMLSIKRACALPTCGAHGGQHTFFSCRDARCLADHGGAHGFLRADCRGGQKQQLLWRSDSAHDPSAWWSFPHPEGLFGAIALPAPHEGRTLRGLQLSVRREPAPAAPRTYQPRPRAERLAIGRPRDRCVTRMSSFNVAPWALLA